MTLSVLSGSPVIILYDTVILMLKQTFSDMREIAN